jgi:hypothetical protein
MTYDIHNNNKLIFNEKALDLASSYCWQTTKISSIYFRRVFSSYVPFFINATASQT